MRWFKSRRTDLGTALAALAVCIAMLVGQCVHAASLQELQVQRTDAGLVLFADMTLDLATPVQEALYSGIPVYFEARATVLRERWYWAAEPVTSVARYMRVSYHPLTRRWRLNTSSQPISSTSLGTGLSNRTFDTLDQVLAAIGHIAGWQVASTEDLSEDGRQILEFVFRLDASRLPAALRVGAARDDDWRLSFSQRIDLGHEMLP